MIVGSDDWFEIWNAERWAAYEKEMDAEVSDVAENLSEDERGAEMTTERTLSSIPLRDRWRCPRTLRTCPKTTSPYSQSCSTSSTPSRGRRSSTAPSAPAAARLIAERIAPEELIAVDRDPTSESRWSEFAAEAPCRARFLRADFVAALEGFAARASAPTGSCSTSGCPRCRWTPGSGASPTPTTPPST